MKKILLIMLIFSLVSGAYAQEFKFIQGLSLSRYSVEPLSGIDTDYKPKSIRGLAIGLGAEFALSKNISFEIDQRYNFGLNNILKEDLQYFTY